MLQQASEDTVGNDLDLRCRSDSCIEPDAIPDRLADRLAEQLRHVAGSRASSQAARLQHQQFLAREPCLLEQGERDLRRFPGAGRRRQQHIPMLQKGPAKIEQDLFNW